MLQLNYKPTLGLNSEINASKMNNEGRREAILSPGCETQLEEATRLRFLRSAQDTLKFEIKNYYRDFQRTLGICLTKLIVALLTRFVDQ